MGGFNPGYHKIVNSSSEVAWLLAVTANGTGTTEVWTVSNVDAAVSPNNPGPHTWTVTCISQSAYNTAVADMKNATKNPSGYVEYDVSKTVKT